MGDYSGLWCRVVDGVLFVYFVVIAVGVPLMHSPTCLPVHVVPTSSVEFKRWYAQTFDEYMLSEVPHFFVGLACVELFFQWPLALASLYAIAARKPWIPSISLIYGVSFFSMAAALMAEVTLAKRASSKLLTVCYTWFGFGLLPLFRGLFAAVGKGGVPVRHAKKTA